MKNVPTAKLAVLWLSAMGWGAVCGCNRPKPPDRPPPEVTVAAPLQEDIVDAEDFTGTTREFESMDVRARVRGFLKSIDFTDGSLVAKGDLLFVIEPAPFEARVNEAKARLESAKAQYTLAEVNLKRSSQLLAKSVITREEFDTRTAQRDVAKAAVFEAQATLEQARIDLSYTEIRAPFGGWVGRHLVDVGNLVGAGENTLLTTVRKTDPIYVYFDVGENDLLEYLAQRKERGEADDEKIDRAVYMELANEKNFPHKGVIDFADNTMDRSTGTWSVRAVFPNKDSMIPPGAFARVRVPGPVLKDAILVAEKAIGTDLVGKYLLVVVDKEDDKGDIQKDIVESRYIELGPLIGQLRVVRKVINPKDPDVVKKGIGPKDRYIIDGLQRARLDFPVTPTMTKEKLSLPPSLRANVPQVEEDSHSAPEAATGGGTDTREDEPIDRPSDEPIEKPVDEPTDKSAGDATEAGVSSPPATGVPALPTMDPPRLPGAARPTLPPTVPATENTVP